MKAYIVTVVQAATIEGMEVQAGSRIIVVPPDAEGDQMNMEIAAVLGRAEVEEAIMEYKDLQIDGYELCGRISEAIF